MAEGGAADAAAGHDAAAGMAEAGGAGGSRDSGFDASTGGSAGTGGADGAVGDAASCPAPNVLLVVDRSTSVFTGTLGGAVPKWNALVTAITELVQAHGTRARFGLSLYPGLDVACTIAQQCGWEGAVLVDPADGSLSSIQDVLTTAERCSYLGTPTAEILDWLTHYMDLKDPSRGNFVVLLTDDPATCTDPLPPVARLLAQVPPVQTFVIGLGTDVDSNQLAALASSGGTALAELPGYYQVDVPEDLTNAFNDIMVAVSCR
jgi:hypothetical protein